MVEFLAEDSETDPYIMTSVMIHATAAATAAVKLPLEIVLKAVTAGRNESDEFILNEKLR
jgi:hypothetical protein